MLEVPVYNVSGEKVDALQVDEARLGGQVNIPLLKQAIVAYHANRRQGTVRTKSRADVEGSTRKVYRQKGTGQARRGNARTNIMRGGGMAFAKRPREYRKGLPRAMRRAALKSALLAKILGGDMLILQGLAAASPKTKTMAQVLKNLKINRSCLLTLAAADRNIYLSSRNLPDLTVMVAADLNAFDVATRQKMLMTPEAIQAVLKPEASA